MTYTSLPALAFELWTSLALHLWNADIKLYRLECTHTSPPQARLFCPLTRHISLSRHFSQRKVTLRESGKIISDYCVSRKIADNSDLRAFLDSVRQFPALKRVTITPPAHGHLFVPLHQTPMIRAFPKGFNYFIPRDGSSPQ
ncbi:hypothetical protein N7517_009693 [Penicillium concentricum]|uniref:Uncharacterized protein n=1 Tax=Penicillium concentricum TaxID=293559 RepID=A0A9W9RHR9_9EURO|nr:uncharacterized protein N7517_009693 [Penicillium concentricum]KAJ5360502.1 hypothetical protein N7517_009693 [Penicillium concentricum]